MTTYSGSRKPLHTLRNSDKVLITLFCLSITVALGVGIFNYQQRTQLTIQGTEEWYLGNESDENPSSLKFAKTRLELLDVTHPHLFFQSIMFFILCHIFSLTKVADRTKTILYVLAFGSVLSEAALPWLIRYGTAAFSPLLLVSTSVMSITLLVLMVLPIREMWWGEGNAVMPPRRVVRHVTRPRT